MVFEDASKSGNNFKTGAIWGVSESFWIDRIRSKRSWTREAREPRERRAIWLTSCSRAAKDAALSSPGFAGSDEAAGNCPKAAQSLPRSKDRELKSVWERPRDA